MIRINYTRLFNLVLGHEYFSNGYDRFVRLTPTAETRALLRNGKMLFKELPHGITVLYRSADDEVTPFVDTSPDQHFIFKMEVADVSRFLNITDLDESTSRKYKSGNIIFLTNDPESPSTNKSSPELLQFEILDTLRSQLFTYVYSLESSPATSFLTVTDRKGNPVSVGRDTEGNPFPTTLPVSLQSNGEYSQQIDLREKAKGKYTITIANSDGSVVYLEEELYADTLLEKQQVFGVVDLEYTDLTSHLFGETEEYKILFRRLDTTWKYFIVNKSGNIDFNVESLVITDNGSANGTPYIINDFSRAYASLLLTADSPGPGGNAITMSYSGGGNPPAVRLSGQTLSGGGDGVAASGNITIINNDMTGYTVSVNGEDFTEGSEFSAGTTAADTATNLVAAINANGAVTVTAEVLPWDVVVNGQQSLVFASEQRIPFYELPKLHIELRQQSDSLTIIPHLSNPSPAGKKKEYTDKLESEIYVFI